MTDRGRPCVCGCGRPRQPGSKYADYERCRQRAYKKRVRAAAEAAGVETRLSLERLEGSTSTGSRSGYASAARKRPQTRSPRTGVSVYFRDPAIVRAVLPLLDRTTPEEEAAAEAMSAALDRHAKRRTR